MATETLIPNGAGDETSINSQYPASGAHWEKVDDPVGSPDGWSTYVISTITSYRRDLYALPAHSVGSGTINHITIYFRVSNNQSDLGDGYAKPSLKSNDVVTDGTEVGPLPGFFYGWAQQWATNPSNAHAWTWDEIDALQIGVSLKTSTGNGAVCTQVYVVVDYTVDPNVEISVPLAEVTCAVNAPSMALDTKFSIPLVAIDMVAFAPTMGVATIIEVPLATISMAAFVPTLIRDRIFAIPLSEIDMAVFAPLFTGGATIIIPLVNIDLEAFAPTFEIEGRQLGVGVITAQYRQVKPITTQYRRVKAITGE